MNLSFDAIKIRLCLIPLDLKKKIRILVLFEKQGSIERKLMKQDQKSKKYY